jgi:hypothetical protein
LRTSIVFILVLNQGRSSIDAALVMGDAVIPRKRGGAYKLITMCRASRLGNFMFLTKGVWSLRAFAKRIKSSLCNAFTLREGNIKVSLCQTIVTSEPEQLSKY